MKDGKYRIKTWKQLVAKYGLDGHGDLRTRPWLSKDHYNRLPKSRMVKVRNDRIVGTTLSVYHGWFVPYRKEVKSALIKICRLGWHDWEASEDSEDIEAICLKCGTPQYSEEYAKKLAEVSPEALKRKAEIKRRKDLSKRLIADTLQEHEATLKALEDFKE